MKLGKVLASTVCYSFSLQFLGWRKCFSAPTRISAPHFRGLVCHSTTVENPGIPSRCSQTPASELSPTSYSAAGGTVLGIQIWLNTLLTERCEPEGRPLARAPSFTSVPVTFSSFIRQDEGRQGVFNPFPDDIKTEEASLWMSG